MVYDLEKKNPPKDSNSITQFSSTSLIQLPKNNLAKNLIFCFYIYKKLFYLNWLWMKNKKIYVFFILSGHLL